MPFTKETADEIGIYEDESRFPMIIIPLTDDESRDAELRVLADRICLSLDLPLATENEIDRARAQYANDNIGIDDYAQVSEEGEGVWIQAWVPMPTIPTGGPVMTEFPQQPMIGSAKLSADH